MAQMAAARTQSATIMTRRLRIRSTHPPASSPTSRNAAVLAALR